MEDYTVQGAGQGKKKISPLVIVLILFGVMGFFGLVCCGVSTYMGIGAIQDMEKTYYDECQSAPDDLACGSCCTARGHQGHLYGEFFNEDGMVCGCF